MKKFIASSIIAGIITTTTPSKMATEEPMIEATINNISSRVSSSLEIDKEIKSVLFRKQNETNKDSLRKWVEHSLFPKEVQTMWIDRFAKWFLWNMAYTYSPEHPPLRDIWWFHDINCAGTMRDTIGYSKSDNDRSKAETWYINKENIDAWKLPDELWKLWYEQIFNLMNLFNKTKIWSEQIVYPNKVDEYNSILLEIWKYLEENPEPGSFLAMYFKLSSYKWVVKKYNYDRWNGGLHINTHQARFLWNWYKEFEAHNVKLVKDRKLLENDSPIDVFDFIANFIQSRSWYKSWLSDTTKDTIKGNLNVLHSLIHIEINWEQINLWDELRKTEEERIKVNNTDTIKISWPVLLDGYHDSNSENKYISRNNHARTRFYFEFVLIWSYVPSELLVLDKSKEVDQKDENYKPSYLDSLHKELEITHMYYLKSWENINLKLREAILRYELWKWELLGYTDEELELSAKIEELKSILRENKYNKKVKMELNQSIYKAFSLRSQVIKSIPLDKKERRQLNDEYMNQIQWLQVIWFMQHEWLLNPETTKINAPIPYFKETDSVFKRHIELIKKVLAKRKVKKCNDCLKEEDISIYFFPWDNFGKVFSQLEHELKKYIDRYPDFAKISDLNALKRNKFIDIIIDKANNNKQIDVSNWKMPSMKSVGIKISEAYETLLSILNETYVEELPLSDIDKEIINRISETTQDYNYLSYIISQESYEIKSQFRLPYRKFLKKFAKYYFDEGSSYWDYQLRIQNLNNEKNALTRWPDTEQIEKAISYVELLLIEKWALKRRSMMLPEVIEPDLIIVGKIKVLLKWINEGNRLEKWKEIFELFKKLFKFNDIRELSIVGKIIQTSLTIDKLNEHYHHLNAWLSKSWESLDDIHYSEDLQKRYAKLLLTIHNRSEKVTLVWTAENYILRVLSLLWDDIAWENYPKLDKDPITDSIRYSENIMKKHLLYYKDRLPCIITTNNEVQELKNELEDSITQIVHSNLSAEEIYNFFKNKKIINFLKDNWHDTSLIPSIEEFKWSWFRELFYAYTKVPKWREPPKYYNFKLIAWWALALWWWLLSAITWFLIKLRRKKKKETT